MPKNIHNKINTAKMILEYLDMFGTKPGFYTEGKQKFFTYFGGILTIFSICSSLIIFIALNLDDLKHTSPTTSTSSIPTDSYRKVKFSKEKIWIPIRIVDYYSNYFNHTDIIYPIITYSYIDKTNISQIYFKTKQLELKLCNETSMANKSDIYKINIPLNELYCINMDDEVIMGGSWQSPFIGYIKLDLYFCKNGIDYNESNSDCTTYEKIKNITGKNNSLEFELYYPEVQFQTNKYINPIIVRYRQYYYHISKYTNKIDQLLLKKYTLTDSKGLIKNIIESSSYWGFSSLSGNSYVTPDVRDLINEGSTSRFYSLNIYLEPGITSHVRKYKNLWDIIIGGLPIIYVIFIIFENIAKIFKLAEENKIMIELLFVNLKEKQDKIIKHFNANQIPKKSHIILNPKMNKKTALNTDVSDNNINKGIISKIKKEPTVSHYLLTSNRNKQQMDRQVYNTENVNNTIFKKYEDKSVNNLINNNTPNINNILIKKPINKFPSIKRYTNDKLFPYKYYFFTSFIKNMTIKKDTCFFSKKFAKVYTFLTHVIDISNYLMLQKEFSILKTEFLDNRKLSVIERNRKINVGAHGFMRDINECLDGKNFHIFSQKI